MITRCVQRENPVINKMMISGLKRLRSSTTRTLLDAMTQYGLRIESFVESEDELKETTDNLELLQR